MKKVFCYILSLLLLLPLFSACGKSSSDTSSVLIAKIDDRELYLDEFLEGLDYWLYYYGIDITDSTSESYVDLIAERHFQSLVLSEVVLIKGEELGFFDLSEEENAEVENSVSEEMESAKSSIKATVVSENPDATDSEIEMLINVEMIKQGYIEEELIDTYTEAIIYDKVYEYYTKDMTLTEEDIQKEYDSLVESAKETYETDPSSFESDYLYGETIYYKPAGFRRVKHILIAFDSDTSTEIANLVEAGDTEALNSGLEEALAGIRDEAQEVLDSIQSGAATFDDLMSDLSDDTTGLSYYPDGYVLNIDSTSYDANFVEAAFALKNPGDISGLIGTTSGYHILRLEEELAEGVAIYDDVKESIATDLLSTKKDDAFYDLVLGWESDMVVKTYPEKYEAYLEEYYANAETSQSPDTLESAEASASS